MTGASDGGTDVPPARSGDTKVADTVGPEELGGVDKLDQANRTDRGEQESDPLDEGEVLGDRYEILEVIGSGGMGVVYRAVHTTIGKSVAIKVLADEFSHREALVERFMQEARAASLIRSEHIVDITDFGFARDGIPYFVMEYLEGQTLASRLQAQGRMPWKQAREVILQICNALQAAHDQGVIHRDMKPDNVFLLDRGARAPLVKVLDFGIAKIASDADKNLTRTGTVMGTAAYMSPEQAQSLPVDVRTDVYAAGIVLYEMLTGRVPFDAGGFVGTLTKHITDRVPSMRKMAPDARIPVALDRTVLVALSKDRRNRYATATELADALRALGEHGRGAQWRTWLAMSGTLGIAVGVGAWAMSNDRSPAAAPPTKVPPAAVDEPDLEADTPKPAPRPVTPTVPDDPKAAAELPDVRDVADPIPATDTGGDTGAATGTDTGLDPGELPEPPGTSSGAPSLPGLADPPGIDDLERSESTGASAEPASPDPPTPPEPETTG